jgi:lipopolysaccharide export system protein LptC
MISRGSPRVIASGRRAGAPAMLGEWRSRLPDNRYSRRVALLKLALPAIGISLLLMVVVWPRAAPLFSRFRVAAIDLREARELRMINPRYQGTDRDGHPILVTAAVGRQVPQRDDVMSLDQPVAHLQSHSGAKMTVTADSGVYQTQTQFLDMFGDVTMTHENGSSMVTSAARLDSVNNAAEGHAPVEGHGPQGDVTGQGFQVLDKGAIVIFTGASTLKLNSTKEQGTALAPAAVPVPVAQAATEIETKAAAAKPAVPLPPASVNPAPVNPAPVKPASVKKDPPAALHHPARAPAPAKPADKKPG